MVFALVAITSLRPAGAATPCRVRNEATGTSSMGGGRNLQEAIHDAAPHSVLSIRGRCVGTFHVGKALTLRGRPSDVAPFPTLDANGLGTVLTVRHGNVIILDLRITDGSGTDRRFGGSIGGGIVNRRGRVILEGRTRVSANTAENGGGIWNAGTLIIRGESRIVRNRAVGGLGVGGGIYQFGGRISLQDASSVRTNRASLNGGGIFHYLGKVVLRNDASLRANHARNLGGGIYFEGKILRLFGSSQVTGNSAAAGGGIYSEGGTVGLCSSSAAISPNHPDDPPPTSSC